ncbi:MAG: BNR-repeat neuraminidase N-terminal domain-containing protein [Parabacteroides merdae]
MTAEHPVLPVLTMKEANPVFKIELIRHQTGDNYSLQKLRSGPSLAQQISTILKVSGLYHTDSKGMIDTNKPVLQTVSASEKVVFNTDISIDTDTFPFWVSFKLKDKVDLSHRFKASCTKIETNEGEIKVPVTASSWNFVQGVAVRQHKARRRLHVSYPRVSNIYKGTLLASMTPATKVHAIYERTRIFVRMIAVQTEGANLAACASSPGHERLGRIT